MHSRIMLLNINNSYYLALLLLFRVIKKGSQKITGKAIPNKSNLIFKQAV